MSEVLELVMPYMLKSPNAHGHRHWSYFHRESKYWEALIRVALYSVPHGQSWSVIENIKMELDDVGIYQPVEIRRVERRRVSVVRVVKQKNHFCTDDDNLKFALKLLHDALKRVGLITDDKSELLEQPSLPEQRVAEDGIAKTIVRIERISTEGQTCRRMILKSAGTGRSGATTTRRRRRPRPSRRRRA